MCNTCMKKEEHRALLGPVWNMLLCLVKMLILQVTLMEGHSIVYGEQKPQERLG